MRMKITELVAENVHGYLPLRVKFHPDLTFLTGLNGSGKTTALRLLSALLAPHPEDIAAISFSFASVRLIDCENEVVVSAKKSAESLELAINLVDKPLVLSSADLQLMIEARRREDHRVGRDDSMSPVHQKIVENDVYVAISRMATPMYLGIDRRFFAPTWLRDDSPEARRREYYLRRILADDASLRGVGIAAALADVNYLLLERMQRIRAEQESLDEDLRRKFFTRAFEYKPSPSGKREIDVPSQAELDRYKKHLTTIERAAEGLRIPVPEVQAVLSDFFERMTAVVRSLESSTKPRGAKRKTKAEDDKMRMALFSNRDFLEWVVNKPQSDRILEHLQLLETYVAARAALREPIDRFLNLVNGFLSQTGKQASVGGSGELQVNLHGSNQPRPASALSSGERQLVVMLGHLSLNPNLEGSGVFIVDEPELSLHISWQEHFVDAVMEANRSAQLILATHSPAIILDRVDNCWSLS